MAKAGTIARRLCITGLVQGVGYRAWFEARARALQLDGWVRNRLDGSVEAVVKGDADAVERIITDARHGPDASRVDDVLVSAADETQSAGFRVLPTA